MRHLVKQQNIHPMINEILNTTTKDTSKKIIGSQYIILLWRYYQMPDLHRLS